MQRIKSCLLVGKKSCSQTTLQDGDQGVQRAIGTHKATSLELFSQLSQQFYPNFGCCHKCFFNGKTLKHFFISAILQKKIARFVFNGSRLRTFVADFWLDTWCENDRLHDRFARPTQERSHWWGRNAPLYICPFLQVALVPLPPAHGQAP